VTELLTLEEKGLVIVDVRIPAGSSVIGKTLRDLTIPKESKFAIIIPANGSAQVPGASTTLHAGDQIIAVTAEASKASLQAILRGE
jgi:Trk K+ transport system NAD-binding subunit